MQEEKRIVFGPFCLDLANECLWRDSQIIRLRPKAFAVLNYLIGHPGQLVTKLELLKAAWPETFVSDAVLKVTVRQLREILADDPRSPRFIETAHRRGYRFIGQINEGGQMPVKSEDSAKDPSVVSSAQRTTSSASRVVGRDDALLCLESWLENMLRGVRQTVFVTGEAGIGKSALLDTFTRSIVSSRSVRVGRGQCLEQYGTGEAYLPILEAIGRLCREHKEVVDVLRSHAPMWLLQMPSLVSASDRELLSQEVFGATRERMLREMGDALEVLTADLPLVLILEDLQWSDYSTLDLISYLSRQRQPAQLMLIGTYRTVELIVSGHPLQAVKRELLAKQQCKELQLEYLSEEAVAEYLTLRFPNNRFPLQLAGLIHDRTYGNPLFMVNAVDYLVADGFIVEAEGNWKLAVEIENVDVNVPESIRHMIEKQLDLLDENERRTLEAASVAGAEFSTLALVVALGEDAAEIEARCDGLARRGQFIRDCGLQVLPNGEAVSRYGFIHDLYQNMLYERVSESRRVQLHRRIGEEGETVYGECAKGIAAELAMHFERGLNYEKAIKYIRLAADNDIRRFAYKEAVALSRLGLDLLEGMPASSERAKQELGLQLILGVALIASKGYAAPDVGPVYVKSRELCRQLGDPPEVSEVLWGLRTFYTVRAELSTARRMAEEFLSLADRLPYPGLQMRGHWSLGIIRMHLGEFAQALSHFEKALVLYDHKQHLSDETPYAQNPGVAIKCFAAWAMWFLGQSDRALTQMSEALALARELSEPHHGLVQPFVFGAILHQLCRNPSMAQQFAETAISIASEHGLIVYHSIATVTRAWSLLDQELTEDAINEMRQGIATYQATGAGILCPHFLAVLGQALTRTGRVDEGLRLLDEALEAAHRTGEKSCLAELYRLKGDVLMTQAQGLKRTSLFAEAEGYFARALRIAQQQAARSWEQRTVISLAQLYRECGKEEEARAMLAAVCSKVTEERDTRDVQEARALLDDLSQERIAAH